MSLDILIKEILRHTKDNLKTINSLKQLEKFVEEANGKIIEYELIIKDQDDQIKTLEEEKEVLMSQLIDKND